MHIIYVRSHILYVFFIMKKVIGFGMFFTGVGIFIGNCIGNGCICILLTIGLLCVGFKLFCCD